MESLLELLEKNKKIPMHMPGHKRNTALAPYLKKLAADCDITEIDGFDNLHMAEGILFQSMERAARMRGADRAFYSVNGSTCGILAAVYAVAYGKKVIAARNCHKSVYNALELCRADTVFVNPGIDTAIGMCSNISTEDVEKKLKDNPDTALVIVTSPTYEGVVSDIEGVCRAAHGVGVPVLVDAAHGAHFGFGGGFPGDAISCGADISVESLHKTLPSLTQTAVIYVSGERVSFERIADKLAVFETSSPSYLLMASADSCMRLLQEKGSALFENWRRRIDFIYKEAEKLCNIRLLNNSDGRFYDFDKSKLVMYGVSGRKITEGFSRLGIECEMTSGGYTVAMTGMGDTDAVTEYFTKCLLKLDMETETAECEYDFYQSKPEAVMPAYEVVGHECSYESIENAYGRICGQYLWAYPPGIPIIIPGEKITEEMVEILAAYKKCGVRLMGTPCFAENRILVIK